MANLNVLKDKLGNILNPHIPRYEKTILFEDYTLSPNQHGKVPPITLKDNVENYKIIEVFFESNNSVRDSAVVNVNKDSGDIIFNLHRFYSAAGVIWFVSRTLVMSKNQIVDFDNYKGHEFSVTSSGISNFSSGKDNFYINKVVGYK